MASLLLHMPRRSVLHVHNVLLQMIRQDFPITVKPTIGKGFSKNVDKTHVWEVRHAGLLGIKYEVAVRSDLVSLDVPENDGMDVDDGKEVLRGVVDAAVLG